MRRLNLVVFIIAVVGCGRANPSPTGQIAARPRTDAPSSVPSPDATPAQPATPDPAQVAAAAALPADIRAAAALSRRELPTPTPQDQHLRRRDPPPTFDRAGYLRDPAAYLDYADGARAFHPAQPAADVPLIAAVGGNAYRVPALGSCVLRVRTEPGFPVSFLSDGLGAFDSGLAAITVAADELGVASARFTAIAGTVGSCPITATSPVRGGQVHFLVQVADAPALPATKAQP